MTTGGKIAIGSIGTIGLASLLALRFCGVTTSMGSKTADRAKRDLASGAKLTPRPAGAKPSAQPTAAAGKWRRSVDVSKVDDSKTVVLELPAETKISGWPATTRLPALMLRCQEKKTEAYITTGMAANVEYNHPNEAKVTLRFDQNAAKTLWAGESADRQAIFLPDPVSQARTMAKSKRLLFRFTPFHSSPQETEFDLRGLSVLLPELTEACGWDPQASAPSTTK